MRELFFSSMAYVQEFTGRRACRFSTGRPDRHANLNDVIKRILQTYGDPCQLGATGLSWDYDKKPDGITMFVYQHGELRYEDCFCVHTSVSTRVNESPLQAGSAENVVETTRRGKNRSLTDCYQFVTVTNQTAGTYSTGTRNIVRDIGRSLTEYAGNQCETFWLI